MNVATFRGLIWNLVVGVSQIRLYAIDHRSVTAAASRLVALLRTLPDPECSLLVVKGDLVFNNTLFRDAGVHGEKLVRLLGAKGLSRVDILRGVGEEEICQLFADINHAEAPPGRYAHIRLGSVELGLAPAGGTPAPDAASLNEEQLAHVKALYEQVSPFRDLPAVGLQEVVSTFLLAFRRGANLLQLLSPVKSHSEFTYAHAVNVSVLSMGLAERLGLREALVQQIGIAGLMHDVGKLLIPKEIIHKQGALSAAEFTRIKNHPLYGAAYLARIQGLTPLAVLAALEHHRKYDATGYPVLRDSGRRQHAVSQIVAIADVFDALRSHRPYKRSLETPEILAIMEKEAGTGFNPALLSAFARLMTQTSGQA